MPPSLHWDEQPLKRDRDRVLLRAAVLHRSEAAFAWLCGLVVKGDATSARLLVEQLAVYQANKKLRWRLCQAIDERNDSTLRLVFERAWTENAD